ncbi:MAG: hypothetical protein Q4D94_12490 [Bacillota bacterium]|nr:hypothetical protein [Bacillota bacterium]
MMDNCKECIRYKIFELQKCGASFVGASFFSPCEQDTNEYILKIVDDIKIEADYGNNKNT